MWIYLLLVATTNLVLGYLLATYMHRRGGGWARTRSDGSPDSEA